MNNRNLLLAMGGLLVLGLLAIIIIEMNETPRKPITNSIHDVIESTGEGFQEFKEEVKDEIDDNTDAR